MKDRFEISSDRPTMKAVVTTGNGGYDRLKYRDVPVPQIGSGEALLKVLAAGVNNTEINTRLGWYSSTVTTATNNAPEHRKNVQPLEPTVGGTRPRLFRSSKAQIAVVRSLRLRRTSIRRCSADGCWCALACVPEASIPWRAFGWPRTSTARSRSS
jgi:hypothetical protein